MVGHAARSNSLPSAGSAALSPASSGLPASFQGAPSLMDTETDEYMDYTGCSPGAVSSESSTMDRSCSSTPVGNESTAAGELQPGAGGQWGAAGQEGAAGAWDLPAWARPLLPRPSTAESILAQEVHGQVASKEDRPVCGRATWSGNVGHRLPSRPSPQHSALGFSFWERTQACPP